VLNFGRVGQDGAAILAGAQILIGVEGLDHIADLDIVAPAIALVEPLAARRAEPRYAVEFRRLTRPLDHQPDAAGWPSRGMIDLLRQQEEFAFADANALLAAALDDVEKNMT
jgi:hypothetical protein